MMNCRRVAELLLSALDRSLSVFHRVGVEFHLVICPQCRRFRDQLRVLPKLLRDAETEGSVGPAEPTPLSPTSSSAPPPELSVQSRLRMRAALSAELRPLTQRDQNSPPSA